jgi:hypothetical protein
MIFIKENYILLFLFLAFVNYTDAQDLKTAIRTKTDPLLAQKLQEKIPTGKTSFSFYVRNADSVRLLLQSLKSGTIRMDDRLPIVTTELSWEHITKLIQSNQILFISEQQIPKEELLFGATDYSCNNIRLMQSAFLEYNGYNTLVSVKENRPDTLDIDLKGRYLNNQFVSNTFSSHASVMSTIIAGAGNTWHGSLGVAPGAKMNSVSFMNLLPEPSSFYGQGPVHIQNHSYGTINQNFYGIEAAAYDASMYERPSLLHVFSAGNDGTSTPSTGIYTGINAYSNMTGNFKQAKNILTVGHTDSSYRVLPASSAGPAFDGRVKPELVAFGEDGSSGAAAIVSGIGLLLQNAYQLQNNGSVAPASLIKACLINGAKDVDAQGIDFRSGYGSADAYASMMSLQRKEYFTETISPNETKRFSIDVPQGIKELKVTLCWTDPSALPSGMKKALINDLDLELQHSSSSQSWLPWVLNAFPHKDSLQLPAVRKRDTLNTNEQISIKAPVAGTYEIVIKGSKIQTGNQNFSVAYSYDSSNVFQWEYPNKNDVVIPKDTMLLRWRNNLASTQGALYLSVDEGQSWELINNNADLTKSYYRFSPPTVFARALLKMETNNRVFYSDTFSIAPRMQPQVAYNCPDSFRIFWNKIPGVSQYNVFQLGERYLQLITTTADTSFGLLTNNSTTLHYAVAPIVNNQTLTRSYTFNYKTQGIDCYFKSFLTYLNGSQGDLALSLGSTYGLRAIRFEKRNRNTFETLTRINSLNTLTYKTSDTKLLRGTNSYRVILELNNGAEISSNENAIYYLGEEKSILYPNPLNRFSSLTILTDTTSTLQIFDLSGRIVYEKELIDSPEIISLNQLQPGLYIYRFLQRSKLMKAGKLVITNN